ncbi:MAG: ABC transporter substrate-binding protein, partial [Robiginitomaculum sp.]|nr:ABC transporter substrate-binding protein [Robiginitomaculum sp.]
IEKSWKESDGGLTWTFIIREGNAFDDGTAVNAAAVVYSFERLFRIGQGPSEAFPGGVEVTATGPMEVQFKLEKQFAPFLYTLANNGASIVNPNVADKGGDDGTVWLSANSAGSGAYLLDSWERGQALVLKPNPHYGGTAPMFKTIRVSIIAEASARRLQLEAGDVDIAESLPTDQLDALSGTDGVSVNAYPSLKVTYLYMNNTVAPLDNKDVRRAISYAIDYQGIIDGILSGNGKQMQGPIPEGMWGQDKTIVQYKRDLDKAKKILAAANPSTKDITFLYSNNDPNWEPIAIATQAFLTELGLNVTLEKLANATMRERFDTGNFGIATGNWSPDFADPYMFTNYWFDSSRHGLAGNRSWYTNARVDEILKDAIASTSQDERTALYGELQKLVTDEAAYVYLFQKDYRIAMNSGVSGFVFNPMLEDIFNFAEMSK